MKIELTQTSPDSLVANAIVVPVYDGGHLGTVAEDLNKATGGLLTRLVEIGEMTGKVNSVAHLLAPPGIDCQQIFAVGLGPRDEVDCGIVRRAMSVVARQLAGRSREIVAFCADPDWPADIMRSAITGSMIGCQGADWYRREKNRHPFEKLIWCGPDENDLKHGQIVGDAINLTRRLVDEPPSHLYPESFAERAQEVANDTGLEIEIWDAQRLADERCGAILAVAAGSTRPARLVILRHRGGAPDGQTLGLVGKGVTFDSGGLSLKPSDGMKFMKCDMAGAATVLGTMQAIAKCQIPANVIGVMGLVENMPGQTAYKLGDVLTARNGTTIEVLNTDAEGRLVLADALDVAVEQGAGKLIDLATLTGACVVALGLDVAGLMTNDQSWCDDVSRAAGMCGERVWQLPMFPEFEEQIKSDIADIKNVGAGRWGGAITAAKLLEQFVAKRPWVHIDIAGPAFLENSKPWQDAGGTGALVPTLLKVVERAAS